MSRLVALASLLVLSPGNAPGPARSPSAEAHVVPPLADPALAPGIARCTSDRACLVTDERGTRRGTPIALEW